MYYLLYVARLFLFYYNCPWWFVRFFFFDLFSFFFCSNPALYRCSYILQRVGKFWSISTRPITTGLILMTSISNQKYAIWILVAVQKLCTYFTNMTRFGEDYIKPLLPMNSKIRTKFKTYSTILFYVTQYAVMLTW